MRNFCVSNGGFHVWPYRLISLALSWHKLLQIRHQRKPSLSVSYCPLCFSLFTYYFPSGFGLGLQDGMRWRSTRKLLTPAFHLETVKSYIKIFQESAEVLLVRSLQNIIILWNHLRDSKRKRFQYFTTSKYTRCPEMQSFVRAQVSGIRDIRYYHYQVILLGLSGLR